MTNGWTDIRNADVVLAMGGNPAENHPVGFRFVMEAKRNRGAILVSVDPRFNRTAAVADRFVQIRAGTDIAFLGGLIHHALTHNRYHDEYVRLFTNAPLLVSEQYAFDEKRGVFAGWDDEQKTYADPSSWNYELDEQGFAKADPTLAHPRSVFQVMKRFYSRYTPEMVATICGCSADDFVKAHLEIGNLPTTTNTDKFIETAGSPEYSRFQYDLVADAPSFQLSWDQAYPQKASSDMHKAIQQFFNGQLDTDGFIKAMQALPTE